MGTHASASGAPRSKDQDRRRGLTLENWPVAWRLFAVIALTLTMGLVFGGLRVASAADSAAQFNQVSQLANLGQQLTGLVQDLQNERDQTSATLPVSNPQPLQHWYAETNAALAKVKPLIDAIGSSFPADVQQKAAAVRSEINSLAQLRASAQSDSSALGVISSYAVPIDDMIALNGLIAQGADDAQLTNDVQTLNSLSLEKDELAQERAILYNALNQGFFPSATGEALVTAATNQTSEANAFGTTATAAEQNEYNQVVSGKSVNEEQTIEEYVTSSNNLNIGPVILDENSSDEPGLWYSTSSDAINQMHTVELMVAGNIVARAGALRSSAEEDALFILALTIAVLLVVLFATLAVARSLVRPLRRLRAGALDVAAVQLPERVRQLAEGQDPATAAEVVPIDVLSSDEVGQVARAFDEVHAQAVRVAGNEALLRRSFNSMFVSLSRRSQSLIERLARTIDSLEQNEEDPSRLSNLFAMDHLVTRMRRNSENLLLLAGHEGARKWSESVPLADVARAATSEIEQYARVTLNIQPGVLVSGQAVSDIVHLLAEIIENATVFSSGETRVLVSAQELPSGGTLIQVIDNGVGISAARLAQLNQRLDDPPVIDESVSRHMGLFAVARLAERHGVRVRLRAGTPDGLTALIWLPDGLVERGTRAYGDTPQRPVRQRADVRRPIAPAVPAGAPAGTPVGASMGTGPGDTPQPARSATASRWFRGGQPESAGSPVAGLQAAEVIANPVRGDRMVAGMPTRVPRANYVPGSPYADQYAASGPAAGGQEAPRPATSRPRSADKARSRLSGFQQGSRRAEGQASRVGEGTGR
jgi:signal transduction histidine kinase